MMKKAINESKIKERWISGRTLLKKVFISQAPSKETFLEKGISFSYLLDFFDDHFEKMSGEYVERLLGSGIFVLEDWERELLLESFLKGPVLLFEDQLMHFGFLVDAASNANNGLDDEKNEKGPKKEAIRPRYSMAETTSAKHPEILEILARLIVSTRLAEEENLIVLKDRTGEILEGFL